MKTVVVTEIERLLFRPNVQEKSQYYSLCFLSEILFRQSDDELANKLVQLYFTFFKIMTKKGKRR